MLSTGAPTNWAGNIAFGPARVHAPASVAEVQRTVSAAARVRVLGTGHSFNRIADTAGDLIRLDGLPKRVEIDATRATVTVAAGMRYAEVAEPLHAAGYALANLASLPHISVAGACATGTHGSGDTQRGLAAAVRAMQLVGPEGDLHEVSRDADPELLSGSVVALGALGAVVGMTLDIESAFEVAQLVWTGLLLDRAAEHFDQVFSAAYSVSLFTDWQHEGVVWRKHRTDRDRHSFAQPGESWLGARAADRPHHPVPGMPPAYCTEQLGVPGPWHERLPHFRPGFTPSRGEELQSELLLPRSAAPAAFAVLRRMSARMAPVLQVSEVRTVAADDLWLSPGYGRDSVALHFTWARDPAAVLPVIAAMEEELMVLGARPHWGKLTTVEPERVTAGYERAADFARLLREQDPGGKFRNPFVDRLWPVG
ncbi:FAD-binding protein [Streptomyces sp. ACA25]|uniref:FAD-binding protein n=1 Tax=Streptomyces sp. ACA25 TaxID=3022596 RepID=UPI002307E0D2|nr:FAD-binding protein [Streptomyces sp. ACA25]MDB1090070.1 FAD-binding protein [Streptomyces sp. ACA25]